MLVQSPTTRDRTRNSLLIAVQELLLDPEPGTLSVPQVIGRAGVSQGTFYNYFDSGLPVDRFIGGLRAHFHQDLVHGIEAGSLSVSDAQVASSVYAGALMGSCLDIHRGHLSVNAIPAVAHQLLRLLGVNARKADRLTSAPQEFAPWRPLPLSSIQES